MIAVYQGYQYLSAGGESMAIKRALINDLFVYMIGFCSINYIDIIYGMCGFGI